MKQGNSYNWQEATPEQKQFVSRMITEARLARDLSVKEAAAAAGVTRSTFYRWEHGRISSATTLALHWLLHDGTESHDAFYWRERAILAEETLEKLQRDLRRYEHSRAELKDTDT
jgi:transcriptional regulator with XRE-family HTH domain